MKRLFVLSVALMLIFSFANAQKKNVNSANAAFMSGKLGKAKEAIDPAIEHEDTKEMAKTWFVYAQVYKGIQEDQTGLFSKLDDKALEKAYKAYKKTLELDVKPNKKGKVKPKYTKDALKALRDPEQQYAGLKYGWIQKGIDGFNEQDYPKALGAFENALEIDKLTKLEYTDTSIVYNAGLAAMNAKEYQKAIDFFKTTASLNYGGEKVYRSMASAYKSLGNTDKYIATINEGIGKFPSENQHLINELINHFLTEGDVSQAMKFLDMAIEKEPDNNSYHFAKGTLYEKMETEKNKEIKEIVQEKKDLGKDITNLNQKKRTARKKADKAKIDGEIKEKETKVAELTKKIDAGNAEAKKSIESAILCYVKALEIKPDYFEANYNMGVMYIKKGNKILDEANNIPPSEDRDGKKFAAKKEEANDVFKKAIPFMEKAYKTDPKDEALKQALSEVYVKLQMYDKAKEVRGE